MAPRSSTIAFPEGPLARFLFADTRASIIWLIVRLYVGYQWLEAGLSKLGGEVWTGDKAGVAIAGFAKGALAKTTGDHPDVQGWYAWFLSNLVIPNAKLFSILVAVGETAVGIALILGILTGIAAFFGVTMNANYLLAGTVSTNPVLIILGAVVMLAWRNAGYIGLDRFVLPALGTPWFPGKFFSGRKATRSESAA
ncbi:MAG TPA: DoxX family protein [Candidatus Limnocylindrales bacterium]